MVIWLKNKTLLIVLGILILCAAGVLLTGGEETKAVFAGGNLKEAIKKCGEAMPSYEFDELTDERFKRPSKLPPYPNPYSFQDFQTENGTPPAKPKRFTDPEQVILAYFGILRDAANMLNYSGGCGSIGWGTQPYPYAYQLLTKEAQAATPINVYIDSFAGIGHITLLKLLPAYAPPDTPKGTKYYMYETEMITGERIDNNQEVPSGGLFKYYYGLITVERQLNGGWAIGNIDYTPEDFLCAPEHGWWYLSDAMVQIVYGDNMKLIEKIDKTEVDGYIVNVYASGYGKQYRFEFVRLTNGYDILLHEYIWQNGGWQETSLLTEPWQNLKLQPS